MLFLVLVIFLKVKTSLWHHCVRKSSRLLIFMIFIFVFPGSLFFVWPWQMSSDFWNCFTSHLISQAASIFGSIVSFWGLHTHIHIHNSPRTLMYNNCGKIIWSGSYNTWGLMKVMCAWHWRPCRNSVVLNLLIPIFGPKLP